jgi:ankyrin repeat/BTB/POZ domain-containing protein 1
LFIFSCIYAALTLEIRQLLSSYKFTKAVDEVLPYRKFFSQLLERPFSTFSDVIFKLYVSTDLAKTVEIPAHRFVLYARSTFFASNFQTIWRTCKVIEIREIQIHPICFREMLRYIYTGEVISISDDLMNNMIQLCNYVHLDNLVKRYEGAKNVKNAQERNKMELQQIQEDFTNFLKNVLLGGKQYFYADSDEKKNYNTQNGVNGVGFNNTEPKFIGPQQFAQHDICIRVEDEIFPCHKAFFTGRSEYFNAMFNGPFAKSIMKQPIVTVSDLSPEIFALILEFIYTDKCDIPDSAAYEVLIKADMFLLDKLKTLASIALTSSSKPLEDIYVLMRTAIDLNIERLEQWCSRWFAEHLNEVLEDQRFLDLIYESAHSIQKRQETDSIPFVDDLRYWLSKKYSVLEEDIDKKSGKVHEDEDITAWETEYNSNLEKIDQILLKLNLDA